MSTPTESVSTETLVGALRAVVREEVTSVLRASIDDAVSEAIAEIRATVAESSGSGSGGGGIGREELMSLAPQLCAHPDFQTEIRKQLEEAFQGVLPGLVKRLRGEIEKRLQSGETGAAGVGGGGGVTVADVIRSTELKETLEERFRTMLTYLQQDVIPSAIRKG